MSFSHSSGRAIFAVPLAVSLVAFGAMGCDSGGSSDTAIAAPTRTAPKRSPETDDIVAATPAAAPKPWHAPTTGFPKEFIEATSFLLQHGLPDPRGKLYSSAKINIEAVDQNGFSRNVMDGWVYPGPDGKPRMIGLDGEENAEVVSFQPAHQTSRPWGTGNSNLTAALLLVAGKTKDAQATLQAGPNGAAFVGMAADLLRTKWNDAVRFYVQGRDPLALQQTDEVLKLRSDYEKEAAKLNESQWVKTQFAFLDQAPLLDARLQEESSAPAQPLPPATQDQAELIQRAIGWLKDVGNANLLYGRERGRYHLRTVAEVATQLTNLGNPAIDALIAKLSDDSEITRQVDGGAQGFQIQTVSGAALAVFRQVTSAPLPFDTTPAQAAAWWRDNKSVSPAERNYRVLADDSAKAELWQEAATGIAGSPDSVATINGVRQYHLQEELRTHKPPSVTDLMKRRITQMQKQKLVVRPIIDDLLAWAPAVGSKVDAAVTDQQLALARRDPNWAKDNFMDWGLVNTLGARVMRGDAAGTTEYLEVMAHMPPNGMFFDQQLCQYYAAHRTEPQFKDFGKQVFLDTTMRAIKAGGSLGPNGPQQLPVFQAAMTPAIAAPEVQTALLALLKDKSAFAVIVNDGQTIKSHALDDPTGRRVGTTWGVARDAKALAVGATVPYRVCDLAAERLQFMQILGPCEPYWSLKLKDAAIARAIAFIQIHRNDLAAQLPGGMGNLNGQQTTVQRVSSP